MCPTLFSGDMRDWTACNFSTGSGTGKLDNTKGHSKTYAVSNAEGLLLACLCCFHSMASSRKCHEGPCGPCSLCHRQSSKFTHTERLNVLQYQFLCEAENNVDKSTCICYACFKQLNRNVGNPNFRPRWKRCSSQSTGKCSIQGCEHNMHKSTCIAREAYSCI